MRFPRRLSIEMLDDKKIFIGKKMLIDNKMLVDRNIFDGKNFGDAAMNAEKYALMEFYGRWCGYYKQLELVDRDKFREKYEDRESIIHRVKIPVFFICRAKIPVFSSAVVNTTSARVEYHFVLSYEYHLWPIVLFVISHYGKIFDTSSVSLVRFTSK